MAGLLELAATISAGKERVGEVAAQIAASKERAEQTADALVQLGIERSASNAQRAVEALGEAESLRAALQGGLEKAHWQVMSAVHGNMGPGAPGSGAIVPLTRVDGDTGAPKAGLDAVPPHLRHDHPTPTGEELTGVDPTLSPFQKEHENADADRKMNRLSRVSRLAVKNIGDLRDHGPQLVSGSNADIDSFGPPPGGYKTMTQVPDHQPLTYSNPISPPSVTDMVGSALVMAVVIAEGAGRILERRKRRHDGG